MAKNDYKVRPSLFIYSTIMIEAHPKLRGQVYVSNYKPNKVARIELVQIVWVDDPNYALSLGRSTQTGSKVWVERPKPSAIYA